MSLMSDHREKSHMATRHERPTVFVEAFRDVTGQDPTPQAVAQALKDPDIKCRIDEQMAAIMDLREEEGDAAADRGGWPAADIQLESAEAGKQKLR
jgi:hypothetical protein